VFFENLARKCIGWTAVRNNDCPHWVSTFGQRQQCENPTLCFSRCSCTFLSNGFRCTHTVAHALTHTHTPAHTHSRTNAQRRESLFSATTARTSVLVSGPHSFLYLYLYPYECICVSVHLPRFLFQLLAFCCGCCWPSCRWRPFTISQTYPRWRRSFSCTIALFGGAHIMDSQRDVAALATKSLWSLFQRPQLIGLWAAFVFPPIFRSPSGSTRFCSASSIVLQLTDVGELGMGMGARVPPFLLTASWFAG